MQLIKTSVVPVCVALAFGCSSDEGPAQGTGGIPGITGGAAGAPATGGVPTGGITSTGGVTSTGGFPGTGGIPGTGGTIIGGAGGTSSGGAGGVATGGASGGAGGTSSGGAGGTSSGGVQNSGGTASGGTASGGSGGVGTGGTGTGGSPTTACTGKPGARRGKVSASVTAAGVRRTFIYYAPQGIDANTPTPLIIVPHGYTMSGQAMYDITKHTALADREKVIAIFPDGTTPNPWNVGAGICGAGALVNGTGNDQAFIDEMIKYAEADQCVDKNHMFVTGFSMGGYFSNETGCLRSDIRAVGPHSGGSHDLASCPGKKKPVIVFHFKNDALIGYNCGTEARDRWVARNGCTKTAPEVKTVKGGTCEYYKGCPADAQVAMCSFDGTTGDGESIAGHGWAGGNRNAFAIPSAESATELGWSFFKQYAW